jgi:GntR family transcriptional regulator
MRPKLAHSIDPTSYKPLYLQISEILRDQITDGKYSAGDLLPSENELLNDYQVSRNTVKRAIEDLVRDGLAIRIQGKGTFVPKSIVEFGLHRLTSFSEEMRFKGLTPSAKIIRFREVTASDEMMGHLDLEEDQSVYNITRIRYGDHHPMAYQDSFLPVKLCGGLDTYDLSKQSLFNILENEYQLKISWQKQYIKPVIARKTEASALKVDIGTPLLYLEGVAFLARDIPIEYKRIYYRSDLYDFSMRSIRN